MAKRKFEVTFTGTAIIEIDDVVIDAVDDEWRKTFYPLNSDDKIAGHIAYNLVINDSYIDRLDGWADQSRDDAKILEEPDWDIDVIEIDE